MPFRTDNPLYQDQYIEGQILDAPPHNIISLANSGGQVKQVDTITVGTAANSTVYSYTAFGQTVSFTSSGSATSAEITNGLLAAIKANSILFGKIIPTSPGAGTITLTARVAGVSNSFTSSISGGGTGYAVAATTPAADPAVIPFGRAITALNTDSANVGRLINAAPSTSNIFKGVAIRTLVMESQGVGAAIVEGYAPREAMNVMRQGKCIVQVLSAVTPASQVFVQHTGADAGKFRGDSNASATALTAAAGTINGGISFASNTPAGGLAILELNLP